MAKTRPTPFARSTAASLCSKTLAGPNPLPPSALSGPERLGEVAALLAAGLLRLRLRDRPGAGRAVPASAVENDDRWQPERPGRVDFGPARSGGQRPRERRLARR